MYNCKFNLSRVVLRQRMRCVFRIFMCIQSYHWSPVSAHQPMIRTVKMVMSCLQISNGTKSRTTTPFFRENLLIIGYLFKTCRITLYQPVLDILRYGSSTCLILEFCSSRQKTSKNEQIKQLSNFNWRIPQDQVCFLRISHDCMYKVPTSTYCKQSKLCTSIL